MISRYIFYLCFKMNSKTNTIEKNQEKQLPSIWIRAITANSVWPDKEELLDVIYWTRQVIGLLLGVLWGLIPLSGFIGLSLFVLLNAGIIYFYFSNFQNVDEEEYGGAWEICKEGFMTSFAGFLVTWIIIYSGLHSGVEKIV